MSKERWQKAWDFFVGEFTGEGPIYPKNHRGGYCIRASRQRGKKSDELFWDLVGVLKEFGIQVLRHHDLGKSHDAENKEFTVGGSWENDSRKPTVNLVWCNPHTLAHEFTHAMDYLERGWAFQKEKELVACAGGYLIVSRFVGIQSPSSDIDYARRQGAGLHTLKKLEAYIPKLFEDMSELIIAQKKRRGISWT